MDPQPFEAVSVLTDPVRRRLFQLLTRADRWVSREEAAEAIGISRSLAAYHLDRLAEQGLATVEYRRLTGREGPGAGRPAKLYRLGADEWVASAPPRNYLLVGQVLARLVRRAGLDQELAHSAAREVGSELGGGDLLTRLAELGFEPVQIADEEVRLANCPFRVLRDADRDLVCRLNLGLVEGMATATRDQAWTPRLEPREGSCCVRLRQERSAPVSG